MSELRAKVANELGSALADWVDNKTGTDSNRPAIIAAINDFAYDEADAVLRVLAEHGDTQQVREQIQHLLIDLVTHARQVTSADFMAVVAPIVAARDAAVERAERAEAAFDRYRQAKQPLARAFAAACKEIADPARPAGHDESGQ